MEAKPPLHGSRDPAADHYRGHRASMRRARARRWSALQNAEERSSFDYGNNLRQDGARTRAYEGCLRLPGIRPRLHPPDLFCRGEGTLPLGGPEREILRTSAETDAKVNHLMLFGDEEPHLQAVDRDGRGSRIRLPGVCHRPHLLARIDGQRARAGRGLQRARCCSGKVKAPIVIGRDHLDSGSVASPNRETEGMRDGSDAVSDWPLLNAMLSTAGGATWVSFHHGGGVGIGFSQHAGLVIVADGTEAAARRLARVLWNDPGSGVMRHADAGYEEAIECAKENGLDLPMTS